MPSSTPDVAELGSGAFLVEAFLAQLHDQALLAGQEVEVQSRTDDLVDEPRIDGFLDEEGGVLRVRVPLEPAEPLLDWLQRHILVATNDDADSAAVSVEPRDDKS